MFRQMRRYKQQVTPEECRKILAEEGRGVLSVIGEDGYPYALPINFYYDPDENRIYLHSAKSGHKIDAIKACDKVCFTVWNQGFKTEGNWEWNATSVVIFGRAKFIDDRSVWEDKLRNLTLKYYPTPEEAEAEMQKPSTNLVQMIAIDIDHMTGKLVNEK